MPEKQGFFRSWFEKKPKKPERPDPRGLERLDPTQIESNEIDGLTRISQKQWEKDHK